MPGGMAALRVLVPSIYDRNAGPRLPLELLDANATVIVVIVGNRNLFVGDSKKATIALTAIPNCDTANQGLLV